MVLHGGAPITRPLPAHTAWVELAATRLWSIVVLVLADGWRQAPWCDEHPSDTVTERVGIEPAGDQVEVNGFDANRRSLYEEVEG
jgi:hypothetical protein